MASAMPLSRDSNLFLDLGEELWDLKGAPVIRQCP